jgi:hypothetical protein
VPVVFAQLRDGRRTIAQVGPAKKQRARRGEPVPPGATLVVRGDLLDPETLRADAVDSEDDEGLNWALLRSAPDSAQIVEGTVVVAGTERFWSWVRIRWIDPDGQVHFEQLAEREGSGVPKPG